MTEIPTWWLVLSGIFFFLAIVLTIGLGVATLMLLQKVKTLQGKLDSTIKRGEAVVERLEGVAKSAQGTVDSIGGSAKGIASKVEHVVAATAEKAAPLMTLFLVAGTGLKLYQQFMALRSSQAEPDRQDVQEVVEAR